jgi:hypothetical protein
MHFGVPIAGVALVTLLSSAALASETEIACKPVDNIDPSPHRWQFEITNRCVTPACITQHVTDVTLPAGTKLKVTASEVVGSKQKVTGTANFVLDQPLEARKSVRFDAKYANPWGRCSAIATW